MVTVVGAARGIDIFLDTATQATHRSTALDQVTQNMQFKHNRTQERKRTAFARGKNQQENEQRR